MPCLLLDYPVVSNVWWTLLGTGSAGANVKAEKAWVLWFNSTPSLLLQFAELQVTEGGWAATKKASLESLPALDLCKLSAEQMAALQQLYDQLCHEPVPVLAKQFAQAAEVRAGVTAWTPACWKSSPARRLNSATSARCITS